MCEAPLLSADEAPPIRVMMGASPWKRRRMRQFLGSIRFASTIPGAVRAAKSAGGSIGVWATREPVGLAEAAAGAGLPFYAILCLPILFAAGMSLLDTIDGSFMNFAYGWAFSRPVRKVYYNITITALSIGVAFLVGGIEIVGVLSSELHLHGWLGDYLANFNLNTAGYLVVGLFVLVWAVALTVWRFGRVEARWEAAAARSAEQRGRT